MAFERCTKCKRMRYGTDECAGTAPCPLKLRSTVRPTAAAEVTTPDANTRGQTGSAGRRARSPSPASRKAVAKQVRQSGQEAAVEPPVDTDPTTQPNNPHGIPDRREEVRRPPGRPSTGFDKAAYNREFMRKKRDEDRRAKLKAGK